MLRWFRAFGRDESGAVSVDWVALTALVVGINIFVVVNMIEDGIEQNGNYIDGKIDEARAMAPGN